MLHQPRRRVHFSAVDSVIAEQEAIADAVEDQLSVVDHLEADLEAKLKSAQSLRQSILRHAFEGKLVPQDPTDEPAPELLKRIAEQRKEGSRMHPILRRRSVLGRPSALDVAVPVITVIT